MTKEGSLHSWSRVKLWYKRLI